VPSPDQAGRDGIDALRDVPSGEGEPTAALHRIETAIDINGLIIGPRAQYVKFDL
jgi:hypothetical protein